MLTTTTPAAELTTLFASHFSPQATFEISGKHLRRSPIDTPVSSLSVSGTQPLCLLMPHDAKQITINGQITEIKYQDEISNDAMHIFCDYACQQLQLQQVIGQDVSLMRNWFVSLQLQLLTPAAAAANQNLVQRIQILQRECARKIKAQVQSVLELANQSKLVHLNAQTSS